MNNEPARCWRGASLCLVVAAMALRVWWAFASDSMPFSDFKRYFDVASEFARTGQLACQGHPFVFQSPGYPLFLGALFWLFGISVLVGKLANAALAILMLAIFWRVVQRQGFSSWAQVVALAIVAFYPPMVTFVSVLGQEMLALVFVALVLWLVKRGGFWLGVCCGLLTLTRPQFILLPFCLAGLGCAWKWYGKEACALLLAGFAVAMTPWVARNWLLFGMFLPTTGHSGYVLLVNNNPANRAGVWMPLSKIALTPEQREVFRAMNAEYLLEEGDEDWKGVVWTPALDRKAFRMAVDNIVREPLRFLEMGFRRMGNTYFTGGTCALYWAFNGDNQATPRLNDLTDWFAIGIFWLSLAGLAVVARQRDPVLIASALLFLISLLAIFVFEGQGRYVLPTVPASAILIASVANRLRL